jgi:hypothetical protein
MKMSLFERKKIKLILMKIIFMSRCKIEVKFKLSKFKIEKRILKQKKAIINEPKTKFYE